MVKMLEKRSDGIVIFELKNDDVCVQLMNLGAHILSVFTKDQSGHVDDIVLGFQDVRDYMTDSNRFGAVVGRVANRIGGAAFTLNGKEYRLAANDGENHLHGGICGFEKKLFSWELLDEGVCLFYTSLDGEEGYPGNLTLQVTYVLDKNRLVIRYDAVSDQDTLLNVTNHTYFNLSGKAQTIDDHKLYIAADQFAELKEGCLPNGSFCDVCDTPFDFTSFRAIGERIDAEDVQLKLAAGYDHAFKLDPVNQEEAQIVLRHEGSGRTVSIHTDLPFVHVYTGNWIAGDGVGKHGRPYQKREGIALETEFLPDSIHLEKDPRVILRAGERFHSETSFTFA